jgi:glycosyltransferase involved in cell wall biosynthesis
MITVLSVIDTGGPGGAETVFLHTATRLDPTRFRSVAMISRAGWLVERVRENGVEPLIVSASGSFHVGYLRTLLATIRQHKVDVIAAHLYGSAIYASLAGLISGIPVISILHGQSDVSQSARFANLKAAIVRRGSRRAVFVSENLRKDLAARLRLPASLCRVIPNGVDTNVFQPGRDTSIRRELGLSDDTIIVGAVGNIRKPKAYDVLLNAAASVLGRSDRVHFVIAGEGSGALYDELLQLRSRLGIERQVTFLGLRADVATVMRNIDIFALSSRTEGFSIACIEAMACGAPVVSTRCGGPEQILNERCGILVPVDNAGELAEAIHRLVLDGELRRRLAAAGVQRAREEFSLGRMLSRYEELLIELVPGTRSAGY